MTSDNQQSSVRVQPVVGPVVGTREYQHRCHAKNCTVAVPPKLLMCLRHWRMVPREIQSRVWKHYRPGQERDKNPTTEYLQVMNEAIDAVAARESKRPNAALCDGGPQSVESK